MSPSVPTRRRGERGGVQYVQVVPLPYGIAQNQVRALAADAGRAGSLVTVTVSGGPDEARKDAETRQSDASARTSSLLELRRLRAGASG